MLAGSNTSPSGRGRLGEPGEGSADIDNKPAVLPKNHSTFPYPIPNRAERDVRKIRTESRSHM